MLNISILWHMHQPWYVNPATQTALMPWVRMHAVKGYYDMAAMAKRHPNTRLVFNLTPVLVQQINELVSGQVKDLWEEWTKIPAAELTDEQKRLLLENFFKANWDNLIRPNPRYHELLTKRGYDLGHIPLAAIVPSFSRQDYLDLQVWFNLAWCGHAACAEFTELNDLKRKGRNFSENDKAVLLSIHHRILKNTLPRYKSLQDSGQAELSTTPFFHPISPLIYDSDFAHRCMPWAALPSRYHRPDDIEAQVALAIKQHTEVFGKPPAGLWPSEGSVCPELIPIWRKHHLNWFATDEEVLFQSLVHESAHSIIRTDLYHAHEAKWDGATLCAIFRDRVLSDFIGFSASKNKASDAAHFINQRIQETEGTTAGHQEPLVAVILDGENAWEYFYDGGEGFLDQWYGSLTRNPNWRMTTLADYVSRPIHRRTLHKLHTGSWIQANFDIWIGDPEENRAWQLLGKTREWWEKTRSTVSFDVAEKVWKEIYAAEGSDWFWWYGPDFQTDNDLLFDTLFRTHLQNVYHYCGTKPPEELYQPICRPAEKTTRFSPIGLIHPRLDGIQTSYFEWHEAGRYETMQAHGAMFQGERVIRAFYYGFDLENFYFRVDGMPNFESRAGLRLEILFESREPLVFDWSPATLNIAPMDQRTADLAMAVFRKIVEIRVPFQGLECKSGDTLKFTVCLQQKMLDPLPSAKQGRDASVGKWVELERHPHGEPIEFRVPDPMFAAGNWSA